MKTKDYLRSQKPTFLPIAGDKKSYVCPVCGSGTGKKGTGMSTKDNIHYTCWRCGLKGDTIDLYAYANGITDPKEKFSKCCEYYGIKNDYGQDNATHTLSKEDTMETDNNVVTLNTDYTDYLKIAEGKNDYKYLKKRGISEYIQDYFHVGYDPEWISPKAKETMLKKGKDPNSLPKTQRVIIPRNNFCYLARDIRDEIPEKDKKYSKQLTGNSCLFNSSILNNDGIFFVTEGEIDAMSIYEVGGEACALGSTANKDLFISYIEQHLKNQKIIVMMDNDDPGKSTANYISEKLDKLGVQHIIADYIGSDPNTALVENRQHFEQVISSLQVEISKFGKNNAYTALEYFKNIENEPPSIEVKTGFNCFDDPVKNLYGGLHEGLYIIGAISSLGKTTFCLQLADQITERGQDVLFFSLEQSKKELLSKIISRFTFKNNNRKQDPKGNFLAKGTAQILNANLYNYYTIDEKKAIFEAIEKYENAGAENLYIYEGRYNGKRITSKSIEEIVKNHIKTTGRTPVIFIDYLQILGTPEDFRGTDKQATDNAVSDLKELTRAYNTIVFAISSFNRENYNNPVSMASFKESGAIEYSSDLLFGLQYKGQDRKTGEKDAEYYKRLNELREKNNILKKNKRPVEIELKCLKNRNGYNFTQDFDFIHAYNTFREKIMIDNDFKHIIESEMI